jgi:hypothetical protein
MSEALSALIAKDEIRDLALLYCRGIDRQDFELVQSLYTTDATDTHGPKHYATVEAFVSDLRNSLPELRYSGHHVCNHLVSVDGDTGEGEVYALAYHIMPDGKGGFAQYVLGVRYLDNYRKEHGRWRFAKRVVTFDWDETKPVPNPPPPISAADDTSYSVLTSRPFRRGPPG